MLVFLEGDKFLFCSLVFFLATQKKNFTVLLPDILVSLKNYCKNFQKMTSKTTLLFLRSGDQSKRFSCIWTNSGKKLHCFIKARMDFVHHCRNPANTGVKVWIKRTNYGNLLCTRSFSQQAKKLLKVYERPNFEVLTSKYLVLKFESKEQTMEIFYAREAFHSKQRNFWRFTKGLILKFWQFFFCKFWKLENTQANLNLR